MHYHLKHLMNYNLNQKLLQWSTKDFQRKARPRQHYHEFDIGEIVHEFDKQAYEVIQSELGGFSTS